MEQPMPTAARLPMVSGLSGGENSRLNDTVPHIDLSLPPNPAILPTNSSLCKAGVQREQGRLPFPTPLEEVEGAL